MKRKKSNVTVCRFYDSIYKQPKKFNQGSPTTDNHFQWNSWYKKPKTKSVAFLIQMTNWLSNKLWKQNSSQYPKIIKCLGVTLDKQVKPVWQKLPVIVEWYWIKISEDENISNVLILVRLT